MWAIRWFFMLAVLILLIVFAMANMGHQTDFDLFFYRFHNVQVFWIVAASFCAGMLVTFVIAAIKYVKMNMDITQKDRQITAMADELTSLRNLPLTEEDKPVAPTDAGEGTAS